MNVSLKQIAQATNLSVTTVSRVLRNRGEISDQTRQRVMQVAREMNYRPNMLIQGIQTGRTGNIGVMVPPYNPYWTEVLKGIHDELVSGDCAPMTLWVDEASVKTDLEGFMLEQMHRLIDRRVDGVILWPKVSEIYGAHLDELESRELPVVTIDHELDFADSVETDERLGADLVAKYLYSLGHRCIGHLAGEPDWTWARLRRQYFEESLAAFPDTECVVVTSGDDDRAIEGARELLRMTPRPTAIFACKDWAAFEVYRAAAEMGICVPENLSVVGYSDTHLLAQFITPTLTTVRQRPHAIGRKAARLLLDRLDHKKPSSRGIREKVDCELIIRESTCSQA